MRTTVLVVGIFALVVAALAGCGGGGDSSGSTASGPTKGAFVREAQALCKRGTEARNNALQRASEDADANAALNRKAMKKLLVAKVVPVYERTVNGLSQLTPPAEDDEQLENVIATLEASAMELRKNPLANTALEKAAKVTGAYGIPACGE
jgi:hypothetical protein